MARITFDAGEGDTEGHALGEAGREVDVKRMRLEAADGSEITVEPEDEAGERWRVVSGPEDLQGHRWRHGR